MNEKSQNIASSGALRAGLSRRFSAIFYDAILLIGILVLASMIVVAPLKITYGHPWYPLYVIYVYSVSFLFFGWFWTHGGQTLGMKTWGIRIEAMDGGPVSWNMALIRFLVALVSWIAFGAGFWWCLFDRQGLALHDRLSGTVLARVGKSGERLPASTAG
jgi:uncharacterized RDD family membrane protein YckC